MVKKLQLTALADGRWRKVYKGNRLYFPKSDYKTALYAWELRKVAIDQARLAAQADSQEVLGALANAVPVSGNSEGTYPATVVAALAKGVRVHRFAIGKPTEKKAPPKNTVAVVSAHFMRTIESSYRAGLLSASRFKDLERQLKRFSDFVGADTCLDDINSFVWTGYVNHLKEKVAAGISMATADLWKIGAKQFLNWAVENEFMANKPKNWNSASLQLKITDDIDIQTFTPEEFRQLLEGTSERTQLYLLLMANTGMLQTDISDLKQSEVNWTTGMITRKRSKTRKNSKTPRVKWKLWPQTFKLLKQFRSSDPARALLNENGKQLVSSEVVDGELKQTDCIRLAYTRVCKRLRIKCKPLKLLRKTGSSAIHKHKDFATLDSLWLGHAPNTMAGQHYSQADFERLDEAIDYLAEFYGVATPQVKVEDPRGVGSF
jgi:integrase